MALAPGIAIVSPNAAYRETFSDHVKDRNASAQASGTYQADTPNVYGNPTNAATTYSHYAAGVQVTGSPQLPVSGEYVSFNEKADLISR